MVNNKHAFWQALIITIVIFWTGIMLGVLFESSRADKLEKIYFNAETDIFDIQLESDLLTLLDADCEIATKGTIDFADQIYKEAKTLEKYDASTRITEEIIDIHKRYDLLRTMLWKNTIELQEKCPSTTNSIVYLYEYNNPATNTQAKQITFSKVLSDAKTKYGDKIILIPIAYDTGVKSLDLFKKTYDLDKAPIIIINQEDIIKEIPTVEMIEKYLKL